jgi:uncharacterized protein (TIGR02996 family)
MYPARVNDALAHVLAQIRADPDEDAPRLVYADLRLAAGDPHGELVSVQCAISRVARAGAAVPAEIRDRERALLAQHATAWCAPHPRPEECTFERGFVTATVIHHITADALFELLDALERSRHVQLASLHVESCGVGVAEVARLAQQPVFARLRALNLSVSTLGPEGIAALVAAPLPPSLRSLAFDDVGLDVEGLAILAAAPLALTELAIWSQRFGDAGVRALLAAPWLGTLTSLWLNGARITDDGLTALLACPALARLTSLELRSNRIGDRGAEALARWRHIGQLDHLSLEDNPIGVGGDALAASPLRPTSWGWDRGRYAPAAE